MINIIIGIFLTAAAVLGIAVFGGDVNAVVDLPSAIVVLGLALIGTISSSIGSESRAVFSNFGNFSVIAGWIGLFIGLVLILNDINLADLERLSSALSVALLPVLYGYFFKICSMMGEYYYEKRPQYSIEADDQNVATGVEIEKTGLIFPTPDGSRYSVSVDALGNVRTKRL